MAGSKAFRLNPTMIVQSQKTYRSKMDCFAGKYQIILRIANKKDYVPNDRNFHAKKFKIFQEYCLKFLQGRNNRAPYFMGFYSLFRL